MVGRVLVEGEEGGKHESGGVLRVLSTADCEPHHPSTAGGEGAMEASLSTAGGLAVAKSANFGATVGVGGDVAVVGEQACLPPQKQPRSNNFYTENFMYF